MIEPLLLYLALSASAASAAEGSRRYVQSNDTLSLWFSGLRTGLTPGDPTYSGAKGAFVLKYWVRDQRRPVGEDEEEEEDGGGKWTYRIRYVGKLAIGAKLKNEPFWRNFYLSRRVKIRGALSRCF